MKVVKNKLLFAGSFGALVLILIVASYLLTDKDDVEEPILSADKKQSPPISNVEEYIGGFNEGLNRSEKKRKEKEENKTPEMIATEKAFVEKVLSIAKRSLQDITFYGKLVDQHGEPVLGAKVTFVAQGETFASGSGTQYTTTDSDGIFVAEDIEGAAIVVERFEKEGYQSPPRERFLNNYGHARKKLFWEDYSDRNTPYVFKAWKVAESGYPKVSKARGNYGFKPGKVYSMDFTGSNKKKVKKEGDLNLDMQVLFEQTDDGWSLSLSVPNGGLIEADELYMNVAPESGYQKSLQYNGSGKKEISVEKKYYIHSRGRFGQINARIRPFTNRGSGITIEHVMNLDGGRNLEVK